MQKLMGCIIVLLGITMLTNCANKKKIATAAEPTINTLNKTTYSYSNDIAPILKVSCSPCHYPGDGGKKVALDSYAQVKANYASILSRVKLPKDSDKFMPFRNKKPALSDSAILIIEQWQSSGMTE